MWMVCCDLCKLKGTYVQAEWVAYWREHEGQGAYRAHVPAICRTCLDSLPTTATITQLKPKKVIEMWPRKLKH